MGVEHSDQYFFGMPIVAGSVTEIRTLYSQLADEGNPSIAIGYLRFYQLTQGMAQTLSSEPTCITKRLSLLSDTAMSLRGRLFYEQHVLRGAYLSLHIPRQVSEYLRSTSREIRFHDEFSVESELLTLPNVQPVDNDPRKLTEDLSLLPVDETSSRIVAAATINSKEVYIPLPVKEVGIYAYLHNSDAINKVRVFPIVYHTYTGNVPRKLQSGKIGK